MESRKLDCEIDRSLSLEEIKLKAVVEGLLFIIRKGNYMDKEIRFLKYKYIHLVSALHISLFSGMLFMKIHQYADNGFGIGTRKMNDQSCLSRLN
ncbi:hypothetical protein Metho_1144 [Methanomethylovorans hollandica DSM 15978]|uniref:Uncharacterized protein n=1 Tax=Methanomethylovorans hollandica (strain DSM 15978 / NBRC 107637 / DMS1) TaxID=867904 RepID=L0KZ72_METHD|nr:hypothetical protein Metho_1144 [Methanomethylovorans hollandica DSM 15978]